ncbi:MAG: hypothetical protein HZB41_08105 [Ignavibacteriae bacterium]|nr:hypothetical protein [Ignavibacteriota bacterium]
MKSFFQIIIIFIFIISYCVQSAEPNNIELSPRVGTEISKLERDYFGLFPKISGFFSSTLIDNKVDGKYFLIQTTDGPQEIHVEDNNIRELRKVLENYEKIINNKNQAKIDVDISLIRDLIKVNSIYYSDADKIKISLINGDSLFGQLLYFDDKRVFIFLSENEFNYKILEENTRIVHCNEIYSIKEVDYPIIIGNRNIFCNNEQSLTNYLLFRDKNDKINLPPELWGIISKDTIINEIQNEIYNPIFDELYQNHFFGSISYNLLFNHMKDIPIYFSSGKLLGIDFVKIRSQNHYNIEFGYKLMKNLSLSLNYDWGKLIFKPENKPINIESNYFNVDDIHYYLQYGIKTMFNLYKTQKYYFDKMIYQINIQVKKSHLNQLVWITIINMELVQELIFNII